MKAVLRAGGSCVRTRLRGGQTHTGLQAPGHLLRSAQRRKMARSRSRSTEPGKLEETEPSEAATPTAPPPGIPRTRTPALRAAAGEVTPKTPFPWRLHSAPAFGAADSPGGTCEGAAAVTWHGVTAAHATEAEPRGAARVWRESPGLPKFTGLGFKAQALFLSTSERHVGDDGKRGREAAAAAAATHRAPVVS